MRGLAWSACVSVWLAVAALALGTAGGVAWAQEARKFGSAAPVVRLCPENCTAVNGHGFTAGGPVQVFETKGGWARVSGYLNRRQLVKSFGRGVPKEPALWVALSALAPIEAAKQETEPKAEPKKPKRVSVIDRVARLRNPPLPTYRPGSELVAKVEKVEEKAPEKTKQEQVATAVETPAPEVQDVETAKTETPEVAENKETETAEDSTTKPEPVVVETAEAPKPAKPETAQPESVVVDTTEGSGRAMTWEEIQAKIKQQKTGGASDATAEAEAAATEAAAKAKREREAQEAAKAAEAARVAAAEKAERERVAKEAAEAELARAKANREQRDRLARERAERLEAERLAAEKLAAEQKTQEQQAQEQQVRERKAKEEAEATQIAAAEAERAREETARLADANSANEGVGYTPPKPADEVKLPPTVSKTVRKTDEDTTQVASAATQATGDATKAEAETKATPAPEPTFTTAKADPIVFGERPKTLTKALLDKRLAKLPGTKSRVPKAEVIALRHYALGLLKSGECAGIARGGRSTTPGMLYVACSDDPDYLRQFPLEEQTW
ncbi:MAG: hypothetical protein AAGF28_06350 [Pseudomonadota bacterium]